MRRWSWALAVLLALGLGVGAALAWENEPWRLGLAVVTVAVLLWRSTWVSAWRGRILLLLALAGLAQATSVELWYFVTSPKVRVWNVYHYYLGAKYFRELGYHDLYSATLRADAEDRDYWRRVSTVRDLYSYDKVPRDDAAYHPEEHFTPERWAELQRDVRALQVQMSARAWRGVFTDRGYNPSPLWTVVGGALASWVPASNLSGLKLLCSLDLLLLAATCWLIYRVFGLRAMALTLLLFVLTPVNNERLVGGFLQYDWFCAFALGFCLLRQDRPIAGAGLMAYAAMTRIFPGVFVVAALVPPLLRWIRDGRVARRHVVFVVAFSGFCALGIGLGTLNGHGLEGWREFAGNIGHHAERHTYGERRVGWKHFFTHELDSLDLDEPSARRMAAFEEQETLYRATGVGLLLLFGLVLLRRTFPDAMLLGLVPLFVLAVSSRYYWAYLVLLPLLAQPGPAARRRTRWLAAGQAAIYGAYAIVVLRRDAQGLDEAFAAYSVLNLLLYVFFVALLGSYLRRDLRVLRRAREWRR